MVDTIRSDSEILTLLADNTIGAISAQDVRDAYVTLATRSITFSPTLVRSTIPVALTTPYGCYTIYRVQVSVEIGQFVRVHGQVQASVRGGIGISGVAVNTMLAHGILITERTDLIVGEVPSLPGLGGDWVQPCTASAENITPDMHHGRRNLSGIWPTGSVGVPSGNVGTWYVHLLCWAAASRADDVPGTTDILDFDDNGGLIVEVGS
jgi:hypothetical protein